MRKVKILTLLLVVLLSGALTSCRNFKTYTSVGQYDSMAGRSYRYDKGKQLYCLWGWLNIGRTRVATPADGNCQVRTYENFGDRIIFFVTGGIISSRTIEVLAREGVARADVAPLSQGTAPQSGGITINVSTNVGTETTTKAAPEQEISKEEVEEVEDVKEEVEIPLQSTKKETETGGFKLGERIMWKTFPNVYHYGKIVSRKDSKTCVVEDEKNKAKYTKKYDDLIKINETEE